MPEPPSLFFEGREEVLTRLNEVVGRGSEGVCKEKPQAIVLSDIEGCLNFDPRTYDHELLNALRKMNETASWSNALPFLTLCTGRQAPFVDAFSAFLSVRLPIIFEGGCGLFFPTQPPGDRHIWHPRLSSDGDGEYRRLEAAVMKIAEAEEARASLGKGRLLTFHPAPGRDIEDLLSHFSEGLAEGKIEAEVTRSANAIDISLAGISKGTAVKWLLDTIQDRGGPPLAAEQVVGVGDAANDLAFLRVVGRSVAPANAEPALKETVTTCSPYSDAKAVADAVVQAIEENLSAASG
jgi:hydroxymethylpyrimidine pyrophosphatase-like HAD family hydrolase